MELWRGIMVKVKTFKRLMAILLATSMTTGAMVGCGSNKSTDGSSKKGESEETKTEEEATVVTAGDENGTEFEMWAFVEIHAKFYEEMVKEWNEQNPDKTINLKMTVLPYGDMHTKLQSSLLAGKGAPDLCDIEVGQFPNFLKGVPQLETLTDVVEPYKDSIVESRLNLYSKDGDIYGLPTHVGATVAFYNTELLEEAGIEVNETDLAEFILQTAVSPPSHIVVPGLHFERNKIREIFAEKLGYTGTENPTEMTHFVRGYVRERFLKADVGVNGCNFAVAESGTCTIVSNEGNGRMASSIPKTQLIFLGTERIVPDFKALDVMMEMLNRSAVGSKISNYFSMMTGPARPGEADGPEETHIIIIDNGRSGILGGTFQEMLRCIRCGACMNICPVYRHVSGHGYGSVYPGPMGAVLTPLFKGYDVAGDLPYASTLCGACTENCPVAIPLHELLMEHRHIMADIEKTRPKAEEAIFTAAAKMFGNATLFDLGTKAGAIGMNLISNKEGNMPEWTQAIPVMNGWTKSKELGSLKFKKFRDLYAEHEKNKKKEKK